MEKINNCILVNLLNKVNRNVVNLHNRELGRYNITSSQVEVLAQLWVKDGQTQKELTKTLQIAPASLSELLDKLAKKKFVVRKTDEEDSRVKRIFLTRNGIELKHIILKLLDEVNEDMLKDIEKHNLEQAIEILKKINKNIQ